MIGESGGTRKWVTVTDGGGRGNVVHLIKVVSETVPKCILFIKFKRLIKSFLNNSFVEYSTIHPSIQRYRRIFNDAFVEFSTIRSLNFQHILIV